MCALDSEREIKMPKAYWVVTYRSVKNDEAWKAYAKIAMPALSATGRRLLFRNKPTKRSVSGPNVRVVLAALDNMQQALAAHDTPAYQEALKVLGTGNVERDMRIVEGD
jgi:uncharacterized protein (DUF1330 family)